MISPGLDLTAECKAGTTEAEAVEHAPEIVRLFRSLGLAVAPL
jgi:hypothetical protein